MTNLISGLRRLTAITVGLTVFLLISNAQAQTNVGALTNRPGVNNAKEAIQAGGQVAVEKIQTAWERIDEKRLKNRTPDEIVAWVLMGCLAGGLLYRFGKRGPVMSIVFGLIGAFLGGIIANLAKLDFGLGPILITYEELICTLAGAVLVIVGVRWTTITKLFKPPGV